MFLIKSGGRGGDVQNGCVVDKLAFGTEIICWRLLILGKFGLTWFELLLFGMYSCAGHFALGF